MPEKNTRLEQIKEKIDARLHEIIDPFEKRCSFVHLYGVSILSGMVAARRRENVELATMAGMLHDFYLYCLANDPSRTFADHGRLGAAFARAFLEELALTTEEENYALCTAIANHSEKARIDDPLSEVLKDGEVLQKYFYDVQFEPHPAYLERLARLKREFDLA